MSTRLAAVPVSTTKFHACDTYLSCTCSETKFSYVGYERGLVKYVIIRPVAEGHIVVFMGS